MLSVSLPLSCSASCLFFSVISLYTVPFSPLFVCPGVDRGRRQPHRETGGRRPGCEVKVDITATSRSTLV